MKVITNLYISNLTKFSKEAVNFRWVKNSEIFTESLEFDCFVRAVNIPYLIDKLTVEELEVTNNIEQNIRLVNELANHLAADEIYLNRFELIEQLGLEISDVKSLDKLIDNLLNHTINVYKDLALIHIALVDLMKIYIDDEEESQDYYGLNKIKKLILTKAQFEDSIFFKKISTPFKDWLFEQLVHSLDHLKYSWTTASQSSTNVDSRYISLRRKKIYEALYSKKIPSNLMFNLNDLKQISNVAF